MLRLAVVVLSVLAAGNAPAHVAAHHNGQDHEPYRAVAFLTGPSGVQGNVTFTQHPDNSVLVEGILLGLSHGKYGFHVHERGDITGGCLSTGGHFNPEMKSHGAPTDQERHVGDLGNIEFDGTRIARVSIVDSKISLHGPHNILGRAVVLHSGEDDLGRGGHPDSRKTGNAGGRVACGVIGILDPVSSWETSSSVALAAGCSWLLLLATLGLLLATATLRPAH